MSTTAAAMRSTVVRVRVHLRAGNDAFTACNHGPCQEQVKARGPDAGGRTPLEAPADWDLVIRPCACRIRSAGGKQSRHFLNRKVERDANCRAQHVRRETVDWRKRPSYEICDPAVTRRANARVLRL
jgi:hypothetical protein